MDVLPSCSIYWNFAPIIFELSVSHFDLIVSFTLYLIHLLWDFVVHDYICHHFLMFSHLSLLNWKFILEWLFSLLIVHGLYVFISFSFNTFISLDRTCLYLCLLQQELCWISAFWLHCLMSSLICLDFYLPFSFLFSICFLLFLFLYS